jgi:hypothetical protein
VAVVPKNETPQRWLDQHRKTAIGLGWACVVLGLVSIGWSVAMATGSVDLGKACTVTSTTTSEPSDTAKDELVVEETEETRTCSPSGLVGPAVIPLAVGVIMCFPAIRLLLADSEIGFASAFYRGSPASKAEQIKAAEESDQAEWNTSVLTRLDEVAVLVEDTQLRLKTLTEAVEPRRKRFGRS